MKSDNEFNELFNSVLPRPTTKQLVVDFLLTALVNCFNMFLVGLMFGLGFKLAGAML